MRRTKRTKAKHMQKSVKICQFWSLSFSLSPAKVISGELKEVGHLVQLRITFAVDSKSEKLTSFNFRKWRADPHLSDPDLPQTDKLIFSEISRFTFAVDSKSHKKSKFLEILSVSI